MKLILASGSPRRKELLGYFNFDLEIIKPDVEEIVDENLTPGEVVSSLAHQKAEAVVAKTGSASPLLAADTIVVLDKQIIGKPIDKNHARKMIQMLSGKTHQVYTGVAILYKERTDIFYVCTDVTFKTISEKEVEDYISTSEPYDKAGSYAVQGIGSFMIEKIDGSYSNVIGLPVKEVIKHLQKIGVLSGLVPSGTAL